MKTNKHGHDTSSGGDRLNFTAGNDGHVKIPIAFRQWQFCFLSRNAHFCITALWVACTRTSRMILIFSTCLDLIPFMLLSCGLVWSYAVDNQSLV